MYIGRIGNGNHYDDGCYILLKEVIDNAIDEYIMGFGKEVEITIPFSASDGEKVAKSDEVFPACATTVAASRWARSWIACPPSTPARNAFPSPPPSARGPG